MSVPCRAKRRGWTILPCLVRRRGRGVDQGDAGELELAGVVAAGELAPGRDQDVEALEVAGGAAGRAGVDLLPAAAVGDVAPAHPAQAGQEVIAVCAGQHELRRDD